MGQKTGPFGGALEFKPLPTASTSHLRGRLEFIDLPGFADKDDGGGQMEYRGKYPLAMAELLKGARALACGDKGAKAPAHTNFRPHDQLVIKLRVGGATIDFGWCPLKTYSQAVEKAARLADAFAYFFRGPKSHGRYNFPVEQAEADCQVPCLAKLLDEWKAAFIKHNLLTEEGIIPLSVKPTKRITKRLDEHSLIISELGAAIDALREQCKDMAECKARCIHIESMHIALHNRIDKVTDMLNVVEKLTNGRLKAIVDRLDSIESRLGTVKSNPKPETTTVQLETTWGDASFGDK